MSIALVTTAIDVRVRNASNTYTATISGRRATPVHGSFPRVCASCTSGPEHAARALARKVFGKEPATIEFVSRDGRDELWRITGGG